MMNTQTKALLTKFHNGQFKDDEDRYSLALNLSRSPLPATQSPEERGLSRDSVRLLVIHGDTGRVEHKQFHQIVDYLHPNDVLVVNDSKTVPASLPAVIVRTSVEIRIHLALRITSAVYVVERRTTEGACDEQLFDIGEELRIGNVLATVIGRYHPNSRLWYVETCGDLWEASEISGTPIRYGYMQSEPELEAYQTIFAKRLGSAEMPSAARPFTSRVVRALRNKGVSIAEITLHTGVSSHEVAGSLADHPFLPEWFHVSQSTADMINQAIRDGRRVIAVGTTVVRALAAATDAKGVVVGKSGWTTIVITPDNPPAAITGLVTGLHHDSTSHLALLYAFVQRERLRKAYEEAVQQGYLWHEFGDSSLIL